MNPKYKQPRKRRGKKGAHGPLTKKATKSRARNTKRRVRGVIPMLGSLAGNFLGGPAGAAVGDAAGKLISKITGFGDYHVNQNTLIQGNSIPTFRQGGDGMRVTHREFISDVSGSVPFKIQTFPLNPGMSVTFPWLSYLANQFEEYELNGLVFEYRPSSGSAVSSTSATLGVVVLATDYDAANPIFSNKQQMESYEFSTSTVPFNGCMHPVECKRSLNVLDSLYLRSGANPPGTDLRLYDMGNFSIATQGMQSAYVVGELWVSYDVTFRKPRIPSSIGGAYIHIQEDPAGTAKSTARFGTAPVPFVASDSVYSPLDYTPVDLGVTLNKVGLYYVLVVSEQGQNLNTMAFVPGSNLTSIAGSMFRDAPVHSVSDVSLGAICFLAGYIQCHEPIDMTNPNANRISYSPAGTYTAAGKSVDMFVFKINGNHNDISIENSKLPLTGRRKVDLRYLRTLLEELNVETFLPIEEKRE